MEYFNFLVTKSQFGCSNESPWSHTLAVVTLQKFYLSKFNLLTVYKRKLDFQSVTDFSLGNLLRGNFIVWVLDMSREQEFPLTATPK